jgi:NlpC/P60 family putative phage cell wall peptidase
MNEASQRAAVIAEAHTWLKTPFHHMARIKGAGVDCAQILIAIYHACDLIPDIQPGYYPQDWHLHSDDERYLEWVKEYAYQVDLALPGDLVMFKFGKSHSHGAVVIEWPMIIHAYKGEGCVISDATKDPLVGRKVKIFRLNQWGEK